MLCNVRMDNPYDIAKQVQGVWSAHQSVTTKKANLNADVEHNATVVMAILQLRTVYTHHVIALA